MRVGSTNHVIVIEDKLVDHAHCTSSITNSLARLIGTALLAAHGNRTAMELELLRMVQEFKGSKRRPVGFAARGRTLAAKYLTDYSSAMYLVLLGRGLDFRFFSLRVTAALLDAIETGHQPTEITRVTEWMPDGDATGMWNPLHLLDFGDEDDRPRIITCMDFFLQQTQVQADCTQAFLNKFAAELKSIADDIPPGLSRARTLLRASPFCSAHPFFCCPRSSHSPTLLSVAPPRSRARRCCWSCTRDRKTTHEDDNLGNLSPTRTLICVGNVCGLPPRFEATKMVARVDAFTGH